MPDTQRKVIPVTEYFYASGLQGTLSDVRKAINNLIELHGEDAILDRHSYYDGPDDWSLIVHREENDEEYRARILLETKKEEKDNEKDRKLFEKLKKKFEPNT